ncbi:Saccharopine dehydrogenase-domain-containing protein [Phialemonium atrogriseum]|uniref:Saccharopine dehydrogenase-domain-containing protein n=1 Tax=Phialemonium atrogriseum TaxID=1093897 RepID=A0AAJ0C5H8_9PEZI|nr:Saccharopine dehydrogenase-domain-containing protein [Phialemonium atrogriseum]KAK1769368.1 Saccharopine dehydrogenase-domain-containing protein [Phialemonium atrogriseum]
MPSRQHGRQYDLVVFGATGYTGKLTAEHISTHLPTDMSWAVAGRSRDKLEQVVAKCKLLNPDRRQPDIEVCSLDENELATLAKKTFILITTVGPYGIHGEHAFKACAENGTHYLDVTGEVPYVARMIRKYEGAAKASGAIMLPQIGIESAPADLITLSLASALRSKFSAPTRDVTVSMHNISGTPSGGTLASALTLLDNFTLSELRDAYRPYSLSPVPNPGAPSPPRSLLSRMSGLVTYPTLGLQTTSIANRTDGALVERTWGILQQQEQQQQQQGAGGSLPAPYGPNFSFREHMKPRNWLSGVAIHLGILLLGLTLAIRPLRALVARFVYQPGEGPSDEDGTKDEVEFRGIADPDVEGPVAERAYCRAVFRGRSMYYLTGVLAAQAASTILEDDIELEGGIYTPACLGQGFIDRLNDAGFRFETKMVPV